MLTEAIEDCRVLYFSEAHTRVRGEAQSVQYSIHMLKPYSAYAIAAEKVLRAKDTAKCIQVKSQSLA